VKRGQSNKQALQQGFASRSRCLLQILGLSGNLQNQEKSA